MALDIDNIKNRFKYHNYIVGFKYIKYYEAERYLIVFSPPNLSIISSTNFIKKYNYIIHDIGVVSHDFKRPNLLINDHEPNAGYGYLNVHILEEENGEIVDRFLGEWYI